MKITKLAVLVLACLLVSALPAAADQIVLGPGTCGAAANDCGPFTFTFTLTGNTATVEIENGGTGTWDLNMFSIHAWTGTIDAEGTPASQNGEILDITDGAQGNNGAGACNTNGPDGAFCVQFANTQIGPGGELIYTFSIADGTLITDTDAWHVQMNLTCAAGEECELKKIALSTEPGGSQVPEPASMILLGTGLTGLAGGIRRRMNKK